MPRLNPRTEAWNRLWAVADEQGGVVTYRQARGSGLSDDLIRRLLDQRRWVALHRGVFLTAPAPGSNCGGSQSAVGHLARFWAAHLAVGSDSVVRGRSAGTYWGLVDDDSSQVVELYVPESQRPRVRGVAVRRIPAPPQRAHPSRRPPVLTVEHTVLDLVGEAVTDLLAVDFPMRACRAGLTTPARILTAARSVRRVRRRQLIAEVCGEVSTGITSPLERSYDRLARRHALPPAHRQAPGVTAGGAAVRRDLLYEAWGIVVELDGRLGHEDESGQWRDQLRDNAAMLGGLATLRFGWRAVRGQPCLVASQVCALLCLRGWTGSPRPCGPECSLSRPGGHLPESRVADRPGRSSRQVA